MSRQKVNIDGILRDGKPSVELVIEGSMTIMMSLEEARQLAIDIIVVASQVETEMKCSQKLPPSGPVDQADGGTGKETALG
jgi:hypothetical protein